MIEIPDSCKIMKEDGLLQLILNDCVSDFWDDWYDNVFNLSTANEFGLALWSIITGDVRPSYTEYEEVGGIRTVKEVHRVSVKCWRRYLKARIFLRTHPCTLENINIWMSMMFETGLQQRVYENDEYETGYHAMTLMYEFDWDYSSAEDYWILMEQYQSFLPHPAGVSVAIRKNIVVNYIGLNDTNSQNSATRRDSHGQRLSIMAQQKDDGTYTGDGILAEASVNPVEKVDGTHKDTIIKVVIPSSNYTFTVRACEITGKTFDISWGNNVSSLELHPGGEPVSYTYETAGTYSIAISNTCAWFKIGTQDYQTDNSKDVVKEITVLANSIKSMDYMFAYCTNITKFPSSWPTNCTSANRAYFSCTNLSDISAFRIQYVTTENPYSKYLMPPRILTHAECVAGTTGDVLSMFGEGWK